MLTTIRLDQNLKNRISALPYLSSKVKSFSHSLRYLIDLGLQTFDRSINLVNDGVENDIRFIAQKHDLGEQLSDAEISFLLTYTSSILDVRSFVHRETMNTLSEVFSSFVKSRCFAANHETIHVFKKFNLVDVAFGKKEGGDAIVSLLSRGFYECMEEVAEEFKTRIQNHPSPSRDVTLLEPLRDFMTCLVYFSNYTGEHILSPLAFRQALQPYIESFIQIAKCSFYRDKRWDGTPLYHTINQKLYLHQLGLDKSFHFKSKNYSCHIFANDLETISSTFHFEQKGVTLTLGFNAFDDLLEMGHDITRFAFSKEEATEKGSIVLAASELNFLWSSHNQEKIGSLLTAKGSSFMLDSEETQEFLEFLLKISDEFSTPLKALRYQLGSV